MSLQVTVKLLQRRTLEVSEIEVVNGEVVNEQLGDLDELSRDWRRIDDGLFSHEVDKILSEWKNDHVEARRSLEMILLIVFLFLWEHSSKAELLIVAGNELHNAYEVLLA